MLTTTDSKMLLLPEMLKFVGMIATKQEFYEALGLDRRHFNNVRNQEKYGRAYHFTAEHIKIVCEVYGVNANWIVGVEDNWLINSGATLKATRQNKTEKI